jgi:arylsulfatase A-like enzyme
LLDALGQTGRAKDTMLVLWSDHGFHLGEKGITGKNTLWERSTRVPLILAGPGVSSGATCPRAVELLDLFPTLLEVAGLPQRHDLEGISLVPWLRNPNAPRSRPAITTHNQGNHAIRDERWRFIRYADGSQELYDMMDDPNEWKNLANRPEQQARIAELSSWLPKIDVPPVPGSKHRVLEYDPSKKTAIWEGSVIDHHQWDR